jgi:hypothetical protein
MKMTPQFFETAKEILETSAVLFTQEENIDSDLMDKLIALEKLVKPFGLPAHAHEVNEMLQEFELFGDDSKRTVQALHAQLVNFATWKLSTNAQTDVQLLQQAQDEQLLFSQVMPYINFYSTVFNTFLYKHCLLHLKLPPQRVLAYFEELNDEASPLGNANRTICDYDTWMQWQELLRISNFPHHKEFGKYCQYQIYNIEDVKQALYANNSLYHIRTIYFEDHSLENEMLVTDIGYRHNNQWIRAKLDIHKDRILACLTDPINMHFQEVLQSRIIRFFEDDEEDIAFVTPVDLVTDYGRGLIINKNIFQI